MKTHLLQLLSLLLIVSMLQVSCKSEEFIPTLETSKIIKDSISTRQIKTDSLRVFRKADSVKIRALISELSSTPLVKKSKHSTVLLRKVGNQIEAECVADEYKEVIALYKEVTQHYKTILEQKNETLVIPKKYIPQAVKYLAWIGGVFLLIVALLVAIKLFKPKIPML